MSSGTTKTIQHPSARPGDRRRRSRHRVPVLTVLYHPQGQRVGERAFLDNLVAGLPASLSRLEPLFTPPGDGERPRPLNDPFLSRSPLRLAPVAGGGLHLDLAGWPLPVRVDGETVEHEAALAPGAVGRGVVLELGQRVALLLHTLNADEKGRPAEADALGLVGESEGLARVRAEVRRVADLDVPVLLRGETGTGKELVATAVHRASRRRERPMLSLNLGAVPSQLAASELFGAVKGSFTGAAGSVGHFQRAHGGTLFLDEIGEAPAEVQVLLLRALESGEIQKVGGGDPLTVDVRLVAATDADLESAIEDGRFRAPLLHRLAGYTVHIPPLRERRDDIGRLLYHFLREELARLGEEDRLDTPDREAEPWLPASIVARLARHSWPGNVRQLRNIVRQLAIASRGAERLVVPVEVERLLRETVGRERPESPEGAAVSEEEVPPSREPTPPPEPPPRPKRRYRSPAEVSDAELLGALRANRWELKATAATLGVSRPSLYNLIDRHPEIRKASELTPEEIEAATSAHDGFLAAAAAQLEVSESGLRQRMRELDLL
jgi:two-component system nitrogen regulation response regulator GlnG